MELTRGSADRGAKDRGGRRCRGAGDQPHGDLLRPPGKEVAAAPRRPLWESEGRGGKRVRVRAWLRKRGGGGAAASGRVSRLRTEPVLAPGGAGEGAFMRTLTVTVAAILVLAVTSSAAAAAAIHVHRGKSIQASPPNRSPPKSSLQGIAGGSEPRPERSSARPRTHERRQPRGAGSAAGWLYRPAAHSAFARTLGAHGECGERPVRGGVLRDREPHFHTSMSGLGADLGVRELADQLQAETAAWIGGRIRGSDAVV